MKFTAKQIARAAVIAALYASLCFFLKPFSYGAIQCRLSEALTVLPVFIPEAVVGLFVGCFIANLLGGASIALIDMVLGSLTTLLAAFLTRKIYNSTEKVVLALLPPVVLNALIVGFYIPFIYSDPGAAVTAPIVLFSMLTVGIGEAVVVYILGLALGKALQKTKIFD